MSEYERLIITPGDAVTESVNVKSSVLTISANVDRLKADFLREAFSREGYNKANVENIADKLTIFLDHRKYIENLSNELSKKGQNNPAWKVFGKLSTGLYKTLPASSMFSGLTTPLEFAPSIYINPNSPVEGVSKYYRRNPELFEATHREGLYLTWRHEREHLIRLTNNKDKIVDRLVFLSKGITSGVVTSIAIDTSVKLGKMIYGENVFAGDEGTVLIVGVGAMSTLFALSVTGALNEITPAEVNSRRQGKFGNNLQNLFEVKAEAFPDFK